MSLIFTELYGSFFLENSLPRYISAKFSALRTHSLTELKINFKITLPAQRARVADECYYHYRAIIRILLRCFMQFRVIGFTKKICIRDQKSAISRS